MIYEFVSVNDAKYCFLPIFVNRLLAHIECTSVLTYKMDNANISLIIFFQMFYAMCVYAMGASLTATITT